MRIAVFLMLLMAAGCSKGNQDANNTEEGTYIGTKSYSLQYANMPTTPLTTADSSFQETLIVTKNNGFITFKFSKMNTDLYTFPFSETKSYTKENGSHQRDIFTFPVGDSVVYTFTSYSGIGSGNFSSTNIKFVAKKN